MKLRKLAGFGIATIAAASFAVSTSAVANTHHAAAGNTVKCYGVNSCSGKSSCKTADNACKGKNSCKGKGFVNVSKTACDQLGGTTKTTSTTNAKTSANNPATQQAQAAGAQAAANATAGQNQ